MKHSTFPATAPTPTVKTALQLPGAVRPCLSWFWQVMLFALLASGAFVPRTSAQALTDCAPIPEGLTGWWPADEHAYDVIGKRFAVLQGSVAYAPGRVGEAFRFDGSQKRVRILESTETDLSRLARWTIEGWVRPSSFANSAFPTIYSEGNRIVTLGVNNGTGKLESWVGNESARRLVGSDVMELNAWSHVALVYDGVRRFLYLNGKLTGSTNTPAAAIVDDSSGAAIGSTTQNDVNSPFNGDIDEISLYNRALTPEEILALSSHSAGKCFGGPRPSFALQPESQTAYLGETITFTGIAMGTPRPEYQWQFNGVDLVGETNNSLTVPRIDFDNRGHYALIARNAVGSTSSAVAETMVTFCTDTPSGLVAWWPGDGSGLDVTGKHHGEVFGQIGYPDGLVGRALRFNGVDTYVRVLDRPALSPHASAIREMTLEAWVNLAQLPQVDATTGESRRMVIVKGDPGRWEYGLSVTTSGLPEFFLWNLTGSVHASVTGGKIETNGWHHIVVSLKKGSFIRLFQDNMLVGETTNFVGSVGSTGHAGAPLYLGGRGDSQFFNGRIDEVALYNRAIDTDEIATLFKGGGFGKCYGVTNPLPIFVVQPTNQVGYSLLDANLTALALGTPRPSYQWYSSNATGWVIMPGATNSILGFTNLNPSQEGFYRASARNSYGESISDPAKVIVTCHDILCGEFGEDFDKGWNGWTTDGAVWQIGVPTSGPGTAHHGNTVAATVLGGTYPPEADSRLISPAVQLPSLAAGERLELRFWQWASYSWRDYGYVQISVWTNGSWGDWVTIAQPVDEAHETPWSKVGVELTAYAGRQVRIAFFQVANPYNRDWSDVGAGWYLDDVEIWQGEPRWAGVEGFENGWGDWHTDGGIWQVGIPTSGPKQAHGGGKVAATIIDGAYPAWPDSRLISPTVRLPSLAAGERLELRFWQWASYSWRDYGYVQISVWTNGSWGDWVTIAQPVDEAHETPWSKVGVELTAYAGRQVRIAFFQVANPYNRDWSDVGAGWYLDDVEIWQGEPRWAGVEGFENGWGDWHTDGGIWQVGIPTSGPKQAHGGGKVAATIIDGAYPAWPDSRLISPTVRLPSLAAGERLELRFWQWASYSWRDYGYVQISVWTNGSWGDWVTIAQPVDEAHETPWSKVGVELTAYAGRQVRIAFFQVANPYNRDWSDVGAGWYLDDVEIWQGEPRWAGVEGFENGWGDWHTDGGIWQVGIPTSGPKEAHGGGKVAATIIDGAYPAWPDSRLISPAVQLPSLAASERLELRFWQWASYSWRDYGYVQISVWTNGGWEDWVTLAQPVNEAQQIPWTEVAVDLAAYAGHQVRVAFLQVANPYNRDWSDVGAGWYVDDVYIKRGNIVVAALNSRIDKEAAPITFRVQVLGADSAGCLSYSMPWAPPGASIDPVTGVFSWTPTECQGTGVYNIPIYVVDYCQNEANDLGFVKVTVNEVNEMPWLLAREETIYAQQTNLVTLCSGDPDCPRNPLKYSLLAPVPSGVTIDANTGALRWTPTISQLGTHKLGIQLCDGGSPNYCVTNTLTLHVTTNAFALSVHPISAELAEFTLLNGSTNVSYILQQTSDLCDCPCPIVWEDVGQPESPISETHTFQRPIQGTRRFYRLYETPRAK